MGSIDQTRPFLEPESVALVGANPNTGEHAFNVIESMESCGNADP